MKKEQKKPDLSKYKPFPKRYKIPEGTNVIVLKDSLENVTPGKTGVTIESDDVPYCKFECETAIWCLHSYELAPLDQKDHPDYKFDEPETNPEQSKLEQIAEICKQFKAEGVVVELILKKLI